MYQAESRSGGYTRTFQNVKELYETNSGLSSLLSPAFSTEIYSSRLRKHFLFDSRLQMTKETKSLKDEMNFLESACSCEEKGERPYIALYLKITHVKYSFGPLKMTFFVMHPNQGKILSKSKIILTVTNELLTGFSDFISIEKLEKMKLRDLTVGCEFENVTGDFKSYEPLLNNEMASDVQLRVGKEKYPAHKLILAMSSSVFRELLSIQDSITSLDVIDVEPNIFYELLRYMYSGTVKNMESFAYDLFAAASKYKIGELLCECRKTIEVNLKVTNVIPALLLCRDRDTSQKTVLFVKCSKFIIDNLKEVVNEGVCKQLVKEEPIFLSSILRNIRERQVTSNCKKVSIQAPLVVPKVLYSLHEYDFFLNSKKFSDVEIHVKTKKYAAHKLLLSLKSLVFSRMFDHQMKETITGVVEIEDLEPKVFYEVLRFIYTNKVEKINMARKILIAANKYEIEDLKLHCETILINKLTQENILDYLIFSDDHDAKQLKDKSFEFLIEKLYLTEDWNECFADWSQHLANLRPHLLLEILNKLASDYELVFK